ncbi:MAG: glutaredoxin domain-containing protein [Nanoarchaeota archaeon]
MAVKIYTIPTCPWCLKTKEFLKENKIKFEEINVASNQRAAKEIINKSGQTSVPIIDINGNLILGFDEKKLKKALKLK